MLFRLLINLDLKNILKGPWLTICSVESRALLFLLTEEIHSWTNVRVIAISKPLEPKKSPPRVFQAMFYEMSKGKYSLVPNRRGVGISGGAGKISKT